MAKKIKQRSVSTQPSFESATPVTYSRPAASVTAPRTNYTQEFKPDYSLVVSDLKKIGGLAAVFSVVLIALSFFLR